ncbi:hypothetical protein [Saccharothrix hoggarensis]|uniref:Uncharacterized protein n=1 Tax=Saccharothrix hoggarensis TaxID=913853 RepID=A0ABW3QPA9_9PSEU
MSSTPIYDELAATYLADLTVGVQDPAEPDRTGEPGRAGEPEPARPGRAAHGKPQPAALPSSPPSTQSAPRKRPKV